MHQQTSVHRRVRGVVVLSAGANRFRLRHRVIVAAARIAGLSRLRVRWSRERDRGDARSVDLDAGGRRRRAA
jgi:hypothetical protein